MKKNSIVEIVPYYQPIIHIDSGQTVMYECLARFVKTDGKTVGPADMAHLFELPEFLWEIFEKTFPKVLEHAENNSTIAINIDVSSISERFFYFIEHLFNKNKNIAQRIHFEVTEGNIIKGIGRLEEYAAHIQKLGSKVVLDDFGTGGANMEILDKIKFDHIKIDGQFLKAGAASNGGFERLKLIVDFLKSYQTPIIGEHIENTKVEAVAKALKIDYGQGYYYGLPAPMIAHKTHERALMHAVGE